MRRSTMGSPRCPNHQALTLARNPHSRSATARPIKPSFSRQLVRAAAVPELRDLGQDHEMILPLVLDSHRRLTAGEGGIRAWQELAKLNFKLEKAIKTGSSKDCQVICDRIKALVSAEHDKSSSAADFERWERLRLDALEAESRIMARLELTMPVMQVHALLQAVAMLAQEICTPEQARHLARRLTTMVPQLNTAVTMQAAAGEFAPVEVTSREDDEMVKVLNDEL